MFACGLVSNGAKLFAKEWRQGISKAIVLDWDVKYGFGTKDKLKKTKQVWRNFDWESDENDVEHIVQYKDLCLEWHKGV